MLNRRQFLSCLPVAALSTVSLGRTSDMGEESEEWLEIREQLFGDRKIIEDQSYIKVHAPLRAAFGGEVPVRVLSTYPQNKDKFIRKHWLIIDKNPSPVGAVFEVTPRSGTADVGVNIRVNEFSNVRTISETNEGDLLMDTVFVKGSGGCSAPPLKVDPQIAELTVGKMDLSYDIMHLNKPSWMRLAINHPNFSGLQMDQETLLFIPAHFVQSIKVADSEGNDFFGVESDISLSANPVVDFTYTPTVPEMTVFVSMVDSKGKEYSLQKNILAA